MKNPEEALTAEDQFADEIKVLEMIVDDMEKDAKNFDGQLLNGKTVAKYFGNQGAAITTLADILKSILEVIDNK